MIVIINVDLSDIDCRILSDKVGCHVALSVLWHPGALCLLMPVDALDLIQNEDVLAAPEVSLRRLGLMENFSLDLLNAVLLDLFRSQVSKRLHVPHRLFAPVGYGKVHGDRASHHLLAGLEDQTLQADVIVAATECNLVLALLL